LKEKEDTFRMSFERELNDYTTNLEKEKESKIKEIQEIHNKELNTFKKYGRNEEIIQFSENIYDLIININGLDSILNGIEIIEYQKDLLNKKTTCPPSIISIAGNYNTGKSWICGKITRTGIPSGETTHTRGISIKEVTVETKDGITQQSYFCDIQGYQAPIQQKLSKNSTNMENLEKKKKWMKILFQIFY